MKSKKKTEVQGTKEIFPIKYGKDSENYSKKR